MQIFKDFGRSHQKRFSNIFEKQHYYGLSADFNKHLTLKRHAKFDRSVLQFRAFHCDRMRCFVCQCELLVAEQQELLPHLKQYLARVQTLFADDVK